MTDKEIFEEITKRATDPKVMDLLRNGLASPEEMELVKRALRYGEAAMTIPSLRNTLYKLFDRLLNVVKDDSTTRQMVKQDLRKLQKGDSDMSENLDTANVAKAVKHDCVTHVVHEDWGMGECIPTMHTLSEDGVVTHYDIMFAHGIERNVSILDEKVKKTKSMMHEHAPANMEEEAVTPAGGEDSSKASKKGKPEMPLEKLKAIMEKKKSKAYLAMLKSQGKMEEETEIEEKTLTKAEMKKREEVAKAIERDQPGMPMGKKMAIATATAKKVAEAKAHTVPKTPKEKSLAALAPPHDKITHADVLTGRGVNKKKTMKEFVEQLSVSLIVEDEIAKALKDKNSVDNRYQAALKAKTTHHLDIMQKDRSPDIRAEVGRHPNATSSHIDKALEDKHPHVRLSAFDHNNPTVKAHHIEKGIKDSDHMVRAAAIQHDAATHEHIKKALEDSHPMVRKFAAAAAKKKGLKVE